MSRQRARADKPPFFVPGRRGGLSVVDAMVRALWEKPGSERQWPSMSIRELREQASLTLGYSVPPSSVRSSLYAHPDVFERCSVPPGRVAYRLTGGARKRRASTAT